MRRQSRSRSCSPFFWTLSFARPLCATTDALGRCSGAVHRRSHVPVIMQRRLLSGSAPGSVFAVDGGHSSCATEKGDSTCSIAVYGGDELLSRRILRHFSHSSGCPGVERQFFELSSAHSECSRASGVPESQRVLLPGDSAPGLPIHPQRLLTKRFASKNTTTTATATATTTLRSHFGSSRNRLPGSPLGFVVFVGRDRVHFVHRFLVGKERFDLLYV